MRNYRTLPTLYEDPDYFYDETGYWWAAHASNFERIFRALEAEYSPIENYDRYESRTLAADDSRTLSNTKNTQNTNITTNAGTGTVGNSGSTSETTDTDGTVVTNNEVSAFNTSMMSPKDASTQNTDDTVTTTGTSSNTETRNTLDTLNANETGTETNSGTERNNRAETETTRVHGNIGVTTSQQMVEAELKLRQGSAYGIIAKTFANEMLLSIW